MNENLYRDWVLFKTGKMNFDINYFDNLFEGNLSNSDYSRLLDGIDCASEISNKIQEIKSINIAERVEYKNNIIENTINLDKKIKLNILRENGENELAEDLEEIKDMELCSHDHLLMVKRKEWPQGELDVRLNDIFIDNLKCEKKLYYALIEAVYHISYDYNIVWYILNDICNIDFDMSNYINLLKIGYSYTYSEEKILYSFFSK